MVLMAFVDVAGALPGDPEYVMLREYDDPLCPSEDRPGPGGAETLADCVAWCTDTSSRECLDWVQSIYLDLDGRAALDPGAKIRGVWLPTIDAVRDAAKRILDLKSVGIDAVSFGPDIVTRGVTSPRTVGDRLIRFYVRLFHTAGFAVYLVPNPMHWGNNDVSLEMLTPVVFSWAEEADALGVELYAALNEVDGMREDLVGTSSWLQAVLGGIRERYSGLLCAQPTQAGFKSGRLDFSGYDVVSAFFSLMVPDRIRNGREILAFTAEAQRTRDRIASVDRILFTDVATFSGGNWAETSLMESQARALSEGRNEYASDADQAAAFEHFLAEAFPKIDGCFFNLWVGFSFLGRSGEDVVRGDFASGGTLPERLHDAVWSAPGLLEAIEAAMLTEHERSAIFDLETYVAGWAGLCYEPSAERPGPFGCTSIAECMEAFRRSPEAYWHLASEGCGEAD